MITLGKSDSEANRRLACARLRDTDIVSKLFADLRPAFSAPARVVTRASCAWCRVLATQRPWR